jgi:hypothetical protein
MSENNNSSADRIQDLEAQLAEVTARAAAQLAEERARTAQVRARANRRRAIANRRRARAEDLEAQLAAAAAQIAEERALFNQQRDQREREIAAQLAEERARTDGERARADGAVAQLATAEAQIVLFNQRERAAQPAVVTARADRTDREVREAALSNGTFFSTIDEVWHSEYMNIQDPDSFGLDNENRVSLNRTHHVVIANDVVAASRRYKKTVTAATGYRNNSTNNNGSSIASDSTRSRPSASGVNIFGKKSQFAHSAHLLPHASSCSKYWIPVVPWVLCTGDIQLSWDLTQKCIHGTLTQTADARRRIRQSYVGIKHFPTNRIRLDRQKDFLDDNPCVIVVPLLPLAQVKNWNGVAYEAIVLAGNYTDLEREITVGAAEVYRGIHASDNMQDNDNFANFLATEGECNDACLLLKKYIFYVIEAFRAIGEGDLQVIANSNVTRSEIEKFNDWKTNLDKELVPVPVRNAWGVDGMKVRKVSFAASTSPVNPAPDPVLLLAKAASNWLKRHNFAILPGWGDDDSASRSDDSADSAISYSEEESIQGRSRTAKKPCIAEVNINVNRDEVEEPLSDDEFLFDK